MTKYAVMRNGKLNLSGGNWSLIGKADAHNRRLESEPAKDQPESQQKKKENIDHARTKFNISLVESAPDQDLKTKITKRLSDVGITSWRKDAVVAREVVLSTSPEYWGDWQSEIETPAFKDKLEQWHKASMKYMEEYFGKDNVIQAELHLDETTPHIHVVAVPIVQRDKEQALCAKEQMSKKKLQDMQTGYAKEMEQFGLSRGVEGSKAKHRHYSQYKDDKALKAQITIEVEQKAKHEGRLEARAEAARMYRAKEEELVQSQIEWKRLQKERYDKLAQALEHEKRTSMLLAQQLAGANAAIETLKLQKQSIEDEANLQLVTFRKEVNESANEFRAQPFYDKDFDAWHEEWLAHKRYQDGPGLDPGDVLGDTDYEARHSKYQTPKQQRNTDTDLSR